MRTRYAITHRSDKLGLRTFSMPANQARYHFDERAAAEAALEAFKGPNGLCKVLSPTEMKTLRVDPIECYDHGDAVGIYVDD
jgi:hypothetical protein